MAEKLLSFSAEDLFSTCERKFYYERVVGEKSGDNAITVVGDTYHKVLADYWRRHEAVSLERIVKEQLARDTPRLQSFGIDVGELEGELFFNVSRVATTLFVPGGIEPEWHDNEPVIERDFINTALGRRGIIDMVSRRSPLVDGAGNVVGFAEEPCVLDYKSVSSERRRSERDAKFSEQLALYADTVDVRRAGYVEIPRNTNRPLNVRMVTYSDQDIRWFRKYAAEIAAAIRSRGTDMLNYKRTERSNPLCSPMWCKKFTECYPSEPNSPPSPPPAASAE